MAKYKIRVTVPEAEADKLRDAIGRAGGGQIGHYIYCSFTVKGVGRFQPMDGADPATGGIGRLEEVAEEQIEVTCDDTDLRAVVAAIHQVHPYEEPVIDIFRLEEQPAV